MARRPMSAIAVAAALVAASLHAVPAPAAAADLKVISAGAVRGLITQIIADYSARTGQKFDFTIGTTGQLRDIIASGQHADLIIVSTPLMGELEKTGKLTPGTRADLGRVELRGSNHTISPPFPATIIEWLVEDGDPVSAGQPLVRLQPEGTE